MAIIINAPISVPEIDVNIEHRDVELLRDIKRGCHSVHAIRVLRFMFPKMGLMQAKKFIDEI